MRERKLTQAEVARVAGVSQPTVFKWLKNRCDIKSSFYLRLISAYPEIAEND